MTDVAGPKPVLKGRNSEVHVNGNNEWQL